MLKYNKRKKEKECSFLSEFWSANNWMTQTKLNSNSYLSINSNTTLAEDDSLILHQRVSAKGKIKKTFLMQRNSKQMLLICELTMCKTDKIRDRQTFCRNQRHTERPETFTNSVQVAIATRLHLSDWRLAYQTGTPSAALNCHAAQ